MVLLLLAFVIATIIGYMLLKEVPSLLHTPLMSGMNALSGITVLGALVALTFAANSGSKLLASVAVSVAMVNVVGGFAVTFRMLRMFKHDEE